MRRASAADGPADCLSSLGDLTIVRAAWWRARAAFTAPPTPAAAAPPGPTPHAWLPSLRAGFSQHGSGSSDAGPTGGPAAAAHAGHRADASARQVSDAALAWVLPPPPLVLHLLSPGPCSRTSRCQACASLTPSHPPCPFLYRSLRMYNTLVERCFKDCVESFRRKDLDATEEKVGGCACEGLESFFVGGLGLLIDGQRGPSERRGGRPAVGIQPAGSAWLPGSRTPASPLPSLPACPPAVCPVVLQQVYEALGAGGHPVWGAVQ